MLRRQNFKDVRSVQSNVERDRVRFDKLVIPYATTYAHIRGSLASEIHSWDGNAPRFLAYQVSIWKEMKPDRIVELQDDLGRGVFGQSAVREGKKGFWSVVNGLTDLDVGHQCNEEWQKRLVKVKQENRVTGTLPYSSFVVGAFPLG